MAEINDFLNPKSMITPGIAVGLTISISLALANAFSLKFTWIALSVSFLFGLLVVLPRENDAIKGANPQIERILYCILNTLVIFAMSFGTGKSIDGPPQPPAPSPALMEILKKIEVPKTGKTVFNPFEVSEAYAQEKKEDDVKKAQKKDDESKNKKEKLSAEEEQQLKNYLEKLQAYDAKKKEHDNRWSF